MCGLVLITGTSMLRGMSVQAPQAPAPAARPAPPAAAPQSLPCPECNPKKRPVTAFGELMLMQFIPLSVNMIIRDAEWARITPASWYRNLQYPWQWDDNQFLNNQFSHPYHGALYFTSARANGYDFWASAPWAFGGSLMWELFFEVWAPSPNDWLNTSLGGIALGEMLTRLSSLTLDNTATGPGRTWREIGGFVLNPVRGFNRLLDGQTSRVSANPPDWRPNFVQGALDAGYRRIGGESSLSGPLAVDQAFVLFRLSYGTLMDDMKKKPFSYFTVAAEVSDKESQDQRGRLSRLLATGSLWGTDLNRGASSHHALGAFMRYEYYNNPAFELGGQSFAAGWLATFRKGDGFRLRTSLLGTFYPIGATRSDVYTAEEGRDYDYGLGGGVVAKAQFLWWPRVILDVGYDLVYLYTLDGAKSEHVQGGGSVALRYQLTNRWGVGASYLNYYRDSRYDDAPDVVQSSPSLSLYVGYALPRFE